MGRSMMKVRRKLKPIVFKKPRKKRARKAKPVAVEPVVVITFPTRRSCPTCGMRCQEIDFLGKEVCFMCQAKENVSSKERRRFDLKTVEL